MPEPPPVLTGLLVVAHATVSDSMPFEQRFTVSVDGEWLGRVPNLAICQDLESREYSVQYCDADWEALAFSGPYVSENEAKARVELSYHGVSGEWITAALTFEAAQAMHETALKEGACSFCGRTRRQVSMMFGAETRICDQCVTGFHAALNADDADVAAPAHLEPWLQSLEALGHSQGFLTYAQLNASLPMALVDPEKIEVIVDILKASGIRIVRDGQPDR